MSDERLRLVIPDDQVCGTCQAVVANGEQHAAWHASLTEHIAQRIRGVERHIRANAQQAADMMEILRTDITRRLDRALPGIYTRLRGVEDELTSREVVTNMAGEAVGTFPAEKDGLEEAITEAIKPPGQPDDREDWTEVKVKPWHPAFSEDEVPTLSAAVHQAIGAASLCWETPEGAGEFLSQRAAWVAEGLLAWWEEMS